MVDIQVKDFYTLKGIDIDRKCLVGCVTSLGAEKFFVKFGR
jgi:hypothetical protein